MLNTRHHPIHLGARHFLQRHTCVIFPLVWTEDFYWAMGKGTQRRRRWKRHRTEVFHPLDVIHQMHRSVPLTLGTGELRRLSSPNRSDAAPLSITLWRRTFAILRMTRRPAAASRRYHRRRGRETNSGRRKHTLIAKLGNELVDLCKIRTVAAQHFTKVCRREIATFMGIITTQLHKELL